MEHGATVADVAPVSAPVRQISVRKEPQTGRKTDQDKLTPAPQQEHKSSCLTVLSCSPALPPRRHRCSRRASGSLADARSRCSLLPAEGRASRYQGSHAGLQRGPWPGLAGCGPARGPRVSGVLSAHPRGTDARLSPGYPRFHGSNRYNSFTSLQVAHGGRLDNGLLVLSKIGRVAVRWSRPVEGTI